MLPTYVTGRSAHGWWAILCLLVVCFMIFLMAVFGYLFLFGIHPSFWAVPTERWWAIPVTVLNGAAALLVLYGRRLIGRDGSSNWSPTAALLFACLGVATAIAIDWTSWRAQGFDPELTSQGAIVGTPYFMSPEQVRGDPVDPRSDIYSLGALMYRALTGLHPFAGPSPMSVFAKHLTEQAVPPHEINPAVPRGMSEIVLRALRKDPAERFQRVEDLQAAVVGELSELGSSGVEALLDSGAIRRLERNTPAAQAKWAPRCSSVMSESWARSRSRLALSSPCRPAQRAEKMPGAPFRTSTQRPESSAMAGMPVAWARAWALRRAFSAKVTPVSLTSGMSG